MDNDVRMTEPKQEQLTARRVGQVKLSLHAHKKYLKRRGTPQSMADLTHHALIGFDEETPFVRAARAGNALWSRDSFSTRTDNDVAQLALIRAGASIGICQMALAARDPQLVHLLPNSISIHLDTWLTMHEDLRNTPPCKVTFEALLQGLKEYVAH